MNRFRYLGEISVLGKNIGTKSYADKIKRLFGSSIIGYWVLGEASGTVAKDISGGSRNGTYSTVTLGETGIGDGSTCIKLEGAGYVDIAKVDFPTVFNGSEGSFLIWGRVSSAAIWTDGSDYQLIRASGDGTNYIYIDKYTTNNTLRFVYKSNNVAQLVDVTTTQLNFFSAAITWSKANDRVRAYFNGSQSSTDKTGMNVWGPASLASAKIGNTWKGWAAHAVVLNREATAAEVLSFTNF